MDRQPSPATDGIKWNTLALIAEQKTRRMERQAAELIAAARAAVASFEYHDTMAEYPWHASGIKALKRAIGRAK